MKAVWSRRAIRHLVCLREYIKNYRLKAGRIVCD